MDVLKETVDNPPIDKVFLKSVFEIDIPNSRVSLKLDT